MHTYCLLWKETYVMNCSRNQKDFFYWTKRIYSDNNKFIHVWHIFSFWIVILFIYCLWDSKWAIVSRLRKLWNNIEIARMDFDYIGRTWFVVLCSLYLNTVHVLTKRWSAIAYVSVYLLVNFPEHVKIFMMDIRHSGESIYFQICWSVAH